MKFLAFAVLIVILYLIAKRALSPTSGMTATEAAKLLDVAPDADIETVVAAHKRLIAKVHPDTGGSAELAARINQARDVLLHRLSH